MYKKVSQQLQVCYVSFLRCRQRVARDSYKWVSYKKGFGCWWVVVGVGGYIMTGGERGGGYNLAGVGQWWVVVDIIWLVVGSVGWWWVYFGCWWVLVDAGGQWWMVVDGGVCWHSLV